MKCPEIKNLERYDKPPKPSFWNNIPKNIDKTSHSSCVNVKEFEKFISACENKWSSQQKSIAKKSAKILKLGSKTIF